MPETALCGFSIYTWGNESVTIQNYTGYITPEVGFSLSRNGAGNIEALAPDSTYVNCGNSAGYWVRAYADDVITESYVKSAQLVADLWYDGKVALGESINVVNGQTLYLALLGLDQAYNDPTTGEWIRNMKYSAWVKVKVAGADLEILDSDLSYDSLVVGRHATAGALNSIPEPTGGLLVLLGTAGLALRRRRL